MRLISEFIIPFNLCCGTWIRRSEITLLSKVSFQLAFTLKANKLFITKASKLNVLCLCSMKLNQVLDNGISEQGVKDSFIKSTIV